MKRLLFQRLLGPLATFSVILFFLTIAWWIVSFIASTGLEFRNPSVTRFWDVECSYGEICLSHGWHTTYGQLNRSCFHFVYRSGSHLLIGMATPAGPFGRFHFRFIGFASYSMSIPNYLGMTQIFFPCWSLLLTTTLFPTLWLRHRKRFPATHCQTCGYDLRATPTRCPECGTAHAI